MHNILKQVMLISPYPKCDLCFGDLFVYKGEDRTEISEMEFIGHAHKNTDTRKTYDERMKNYLEESIQDIAETIKELGDTMVRHRKILRDMEGE